MPAMMPRMASLSVPLLLLFPLPSLPELPFGRKVVSAIALSKPAFAPHETGRDFEPDPKPPAFGFNGEDT